MVATDLGKVIKMPAVCPGGAHKTNEAKFLLLSYTLTTGILLIV